MAGPMRPCRNSTPSGPALIPWPWRSSVISPETITLKPQCCQFGKQRFRFIAHASARNEAAVMQIDGCFYRATITRANLMWGNRLINGNELVSG